MKLHEEINAFRVLLNDIYERTGYRLDVLENELATAKQKKILEDVYDVKPFRVQTITLERIFVDKLFAAETDKQIIYFYI